MAPIWAAQAWQATHTGDVPVRVSSKAWNQGAAWQTVPDWQARGSTGTATRVNRSQVGGREQEEQTRTVVPGVSEWQERPTGRCACTPRSWGGIPMRVTSAYSHTSRFLP